MDDQVRGPFFPVSRQPLLAFGQKEVNALASENQEPFEDGVVGDVLEGTEIEEPCDLIELDGDRDSGSQGFQVFPEEVDLFPWRGSRPGGGQGHQLAAGGRRRVLPDRVHQVAPHGDHFPSGLAQAFLEGPGGGQGEHHGVHAHPEAVPFSGQTLEVFVKPRHAGSAQLHRCDARAGKLLFRLDVIAAVHVEPGLLATHEQVPC